MEGGKIRPSHNSSGKTLAMGNNLRWYARTTELNNSMTAGMHVFNRTSSAQATTTGPPRPLHGEGPGHRGEPVDAVREVTRCALSWDLKEKKAKFEVFKKNTMYVHKFNTRKDKPYKLGLNRFDKFKKKYTGAKPIDCDATKHKMATAASTKVADGSCWAFSGTESVESNAIVTGSLLSLSEQQILYCSGAGNCEYGGQSCVFEHAMQTGIALDCNYPPYEAMDDQCRIDYLYGCRIAEQDPMVKIDESEEMPAYKEKALKYRVYLQPMSVHIEASYDRTLYQEGVFAGAAVRIWATRWWRSATA
ncbi:thiol protease SEN102-like [Phragmites australis]|uniref:thiol protease SEN102-like n=1 Tax=Phragmites australis TaxID=29695 RepID=UPI002D783835|nr:thiol protease SEN102-like [Phragmites australis]